MPNFIQNTKTLDNYSIRQGQKSENLESYFSSLSLNLCNEQTRSSICLLLFTFNKYNEISYNELNK